MKTCLRRILFFRRTETRFDRLIDNCRLYTDCSLRDEQRDEFPSLASIIFHLVMPTKRNASQEQPLRQSPVTGSLSVAMLVTFFLTIDATTLEFRSSDKGEKDGERVHVAMSISGSGHSFAIPSSKSRSMWERVSLAMFHRH